MTTSTTPEALALLPHVIDAVTEAGAMIRAEFHRAGGPRGGGSHADIDTEVEEMLKRRLLALRSCGWAGEETDDVSSPDDARWVVDPHDGTRDFLKGLRGSAVSVALLESGVPVLGVVHAPLAPDDGGDLITWAKGGAVVRNGVPVRPRNNNGDPVIALNADAADYAQHNHVAIPGFRVWALPSPAYRLALAAAGEVEAAVSLVPGLLWWDIAGGHALLMGADKVLADRDGYPIDYRRSRNFDGCIGGGKKLVARLAAMRPGSGRKVPRGAVRPARRVSDATRLSRAQGSLLGQLAGDALGSAVEFQSASAIARSHPEGVRQLTDGGTWNLIAGQPTDDSEMALALARSLVKKRGFDAGDVAGAYVAWQASRPFDIGGTTASGIAALAAGRRAASESQSNGALMRASPIGIVAAGSPALAAELARRDAALTHPHPVCQAANAAYAAAIATGIAGGDAEAMWRAAHDRAGSDGAADNVRARLKEARHAPPREFQHQMGWVLTAFHNAFHWLMQAASLEEAVIATVGCGGDTDSNAAVCGALLGALQGRAAVPLQWRNAVLTCRPVSAPGIHHPRPTDYWPDDALELAEALLTAAP